MYLPAEHGLHPGLLFRGAAVQPQPFPMSAPSRLYFHRARNAIYHLVRALGLDRGQTVLVPDYHNGNEVQAIRAAGANVCFYRVGRSLELDLDHLTSLCRSTDARALFAIHYFGWPQPVKELQQLSQHHDLVLIEDCALSLLSETLGQPLGSFGHYSTYCLYKTLPVPNGGVLAQNEGELEVLRHLPLERCGTTTQVGRTVELVLEWLRNRSYVAGHGAFVVKRSIGRALSALSVPRVPFGEPGFDLGSAHVSMMDLSRALLDRFDYAEIRRRRRENYARLRERLEGRVALLPRELEPGTCPLIFPLLVPDKPGAARALQQRGVEAMEFWNDGDLEARGAGHADAVYLRQHLVELPIHQEIRLEQVDFMADQVLAVGAHY